MSHRPSIDAYESILQYKVTSWLLSLPEVNKAIEARLDEIGIPGLSALPGSHSGIGRETLGRALFKYKIDGEMYGSFIELLESIANQSGFLKHHEFKFQPRKHEIRLLGQAVEQSGWWEMFKGTIAQNRRNLQKVRQVQES